MKVFRVKATYVGHGEDKSLIIVAKTKQRALEIANNGHPWEEYGGKDKQGRQRDFEVDNNFWDFKEWQKPLIVYEIGLSIEKVIEVASVND